jgi:hypothetical protein
MKIATWTCLIYQHDVAGPASSRLAKGLNPINCRRFHLWQLSILGEPQV